MINLPSFSWMHGRPERGLRRLLIGNDVDSLRPSSTFTELQCDK